MQPATTVRTDPQSKSLSGRFFILIGPAGAGKNTLMQAVLDRYAGQIRQLPTATSRAIRPTEQKGREHVFLTEEGFEQRVAVGDFLEYQRVHGRWYGILRETLETMLNTLPGTIADIEYLGAKVAKAAYPANSVTCFVQPPGIADLHLRMQNRGDKYEEIARRLLRVPAELDYARECDYVLANHDIGQASRQMVEIVEAELQGKRADVPHPPQLNFAYAVRVAVLHGDEALISGDEGWPEREFNPEINPNTIANEILHTLGLQVILPQPESGFLPPTALCIEQMEAQGNSRAYERVIYQYEINLPERPPAPAGMRWARVVRIGTSVEIARLELA